MLGRKTCKADQKHTIQNGAALGNTQGESKPSAVDAESRKQGRRSADPTLRFFPPMDPDSDSFCHSSSFLVGSAFWERPAEGSPADGTGAKSIPGGRTPEGYWSLKEFENARETRRGPVGDPTGFFFYTEY